LSREDLACIGLIILGILLFLYGANYYNSLVGWTGVFLMIGGVIALGALAIYNNLVKRKPEEKPVATPVELQNP
jgi:hypothetical protein